MKKSLKSIIQIWNDFEQSPDRERGSEDKPSEIIAYKNGAMERCTANCDAEFAGKTIAFLVHTFSDTPENEARLNRAFHLGLNETTGQK